MKKKTKKKVEPFKPWVRRVHKMLREKFFVKEYEYTLFWAKEDKKSATHAGSSVGGEIDISISYLNYDLTLYPILHRKYKRADYFGVLSVLVHEMCHIYTEPLYCFAIDAVTNTNKEFLEQIREQNTQRIAACIYELMPEKLWKPKIK